MCEPPAVAWDMRFRPGLLALLPLLVLPLRASGVEVAAGLGLTQIRSSGPAYPNGEAAAGLQVRVGWDRSPDYQRMTQGQVLAESGSTSDLRFAAAGAGLQRSWWTRNHGAEVALGTELRVERYEGRSSLQAPSSPLQGQTAWMARPWVRLQVGLRGILVPTQYTNLLGQVLWGGRTTHPFTRLDVAAPLWTQGGLGPSGALRRMAPRYEVALQIGMRFGQEDP